VTVLLRHHDLKTYESYQPRQCHGTNTLCHAVHAGDCFDADPWLMVTTTCRGWHDRRSLPRRNCREPVAASRRPCCIQDFSRLCPFLSSARAEKRSNGNAFRNPPKKLPGSRKAESNRRVSEPANHQKRHLTRPVPSRSRSGPAQTDSRAPPPARDATQTQPSIERASRTIPNQPARVPPCFDRPEEPVQMRQCRLPLSEEEEKVAQHRIGCLSAFAFCFSLLLF
jgi:hypothetical protein